ncbi:hypothetical protein HK098_000606, partial [Nowakowskiella sp. JEL0407]
MTADWNLQIVSECISSHIKSLGGVDFIITFDHYGISGHSNHRATYHGVKRLISDQSEPLMKAFSLRSVSVFRKFLSVLDFPLTIYLHNRKIVHQQTH